MTIRDLYERAERLGIADRHLRIRVSRDEHETVSGCSTEDVEMLPAEYAPGAVVLEVSGLRRWP